MPREKKDVEAGLEAKGFTKGSGDHNYYIYFGRDGKKSMARTKTSHGPNKTLGEELISRMAKQCSLTKKQFGELIDCPLSREMYESILVKKGLYSPESE